MQESPDHASARCGQLERLDSERIVIIIRIVDQEAVEDVLLHALGFVAGRNQWTSSSNGHVTLFDAHVLVEFVAVRFDLVDNDAPFARDIDGAQRLHVGRSAGAEVSLLDQFVQSIDRVLSVEGNVLVDRQDGFVVLIESVLHFVGGVFRICQTPRLRRVLRASGDFVVFGGLVAGLVRRLVRV